ncbi:methyltransferase domain-containing protein [candidate division KSB1 bacterium]|nr:methyltransferase domain-containing protein [candidate division KSB1 bacterium]
MNSSIHSSNLSITDTGERILPTSEGEVSYVFTRHKFAYEYIQSFVDNKDVIDVGCGSGYGSHILAQRARRVTGIDHEAEAIRFCRRHYAAANLEFIRADASTFVPESRYDLAVCLQAIEHFADVSAFLDRLMQMVKPGGMIFISTPNVRKKYKGTKKNPYHHSEMSHDQFVEILRDKFERFDMLGVAYARRNRLRSVLAKMPFYRWGRFIKRSSRIKKIAGRALDLTRFEVIREGLAEQAADLLAVCHVP